MMKLAFRCSLVPIVRLKCRPLPSAGCCCLTVVVVVVALVGVVVDVVVVRLRAALVAAHRLPPRAQRHRL